MAESQPPQPPQTKEIATALSPKNQVLKNKLLDLGNRVPSQRKAEFLKDRWDFGAKLQKKFPDYKKREVFHVIIGSTLIPNTDPNFYEPEDFSVEEGEDYSVAKFIEDLIVKYSI